MPRSIFLTAAALFLVSCSKEKHVEPVVQVVRAGVVEEIRPDVSERYSASIEPFAKVDLAFKSGGLIAGILQVRGADGRVRNVEAGDKVAKGALLAQVRPLDYEHSVAQAEAQRAQAESQVAHAQAQLAQARANFNTAEIEYTRATNLFQSASLVKPQYDQAKGRYESDAASVAAAEAEVKAAEDAVASARAAAQEAKLALSDTKVRAPFAGWVTARNVNLGSLVGSSTVGFSLQDTHLVKAVFGVPDTALSNIRRGQKQPVRLDALERAVPGVITSISPQADPQSRVFSIEVTIDNAQEQIRPGMIGSITLGGSRDSRPRLVVPLAAVVRAPANPNGFAVFRLVVRDGKSYASAQTIEIGDTFGNSIEVKRSLVPGQRIISLGAALVRDGQQVSVIP
jgi:multidrug efflux pump subunit AcrA (membrane-fusion protein)